MKFLGVLFLFGIALAVPEPPAGPYAPRGWRPSGPAFELPTETKQPTQEYGAPNLKTEVEVTEEEIQYTGELGTTEPTTPFQEYGPPATDFPDDVYTTVPSDDENDLSVQGLPGTDAAAEFRTNPIGGQRYTFSRNQRFRQDSRPAKLRELPLRPQQTRQPQSFQQVQFQRQQQFTQAFQPSFPQFGARLQTFPVQNRFNQQFAPQQFGRLVAAPQRQPSNLRSLPVFSQRQTLDSYGAPAKNYGPPTQEYAPPPQEYGAPVTEAPVEEPEQFAPEQEPETVPQEPEEDNEEDTEPNDDETGNGPNVAISTAIATARYRTARLQNQRNANQRSANVRTARYQQIQEPIYMYDQFGRLIRIF